MLHTVNKSPLERNTLESCLRLAAKGSAILLIEDGVYGALAAGQAAKEIGKRKADLKFYALGPDLAARGLSESPLVDGIEIVDYEGFVDLAAEYEAHQAWL
ncbi:MAG: sulfurtransferase complex subunit TusB [Alphaproteobacteria bacterium]|jgi:tRNA 2-thiouridine synthesizing protein B|nr:sulfurtransferase complex subunit TusB [Alphaproteobacteria bacterium]MDH5556044.1 sulfurtransferase complex subunit TusB [Alphaproteobacteria bacterium]